MATRKAQISMAKPIVKTMSMKLVGASPLIVEKWHGYPRPANQDQIRNFIGSLFWLTPEPGEFTHEAYELALASGARFGFPTRCIKQSAVNAAYRAGKVNSKILLMAAFRIYAGDLVEIQGTPVMRKDELIVGNGQEAIPIYRAEFPEWAMEFNIQYNSAAVSPEQIREFFALGGANFGIGAWRPEKGGEFGKFTVA